MVLFNPETCCCETPPSSFDMLKVALPVILEGGDVQETAEEEIHRAGRTNLIESPGRSHKHESVGELKKPRPLTNITSPPDSVANRRVKEKVLIMGGGRIVRGRVEVSHVSPPFKDSSTVLSDGIALPNLSMGLRLTNV